MRTVEENGFYVSGGYQNIPPQNIIPLSVEFPRQTNLQSNLFRPSDSDFCDTSSSMKSTTLFLGDLSVVCDEEKLFNLFRPFGEIESVELKKSDRDPQRAHLGFGFIKFVHHEGAERAVREVNGMFFLGRAIRVGWADDNEKRRGPGKGSAVGRYQEKAADLKKTRQTAQIHVMFVTREMNRRVSELDLGSVFGRYGNLVDIAIKKNAINADLRVQSGYAFIHYQLTEEGVQSAVMAVEQTNNASIDGIAYQCKITHSLQAHIFAKKYRSSGSPPRTSPSPVFSEPPSFYPPGLRVGGMPHHHQQQPPVFRDYSMTPPPPQRYESLVIQPPQQTITQFMAESAPAYTYHPDNYITASSMSWTDSERLSDESFQSSYQSLASFKGDERPSSYRWSLSQQHHQYGVASQGFFPQSYSGSPEFTSFTNGGINNHNNI
mmetsp:Transcript_7787/g.8518  ORF Transcript_7787/g.8518 Transcript_7787/m.8518 type:complete len:434 (-) Transcript_7787:293-1594(-)|eukprot:CAMPEP_0173150528 /NCGR_PEP_ID=MMETSP1105-20130129/11017_1 /TAXON_ID=2985 /ORGANISM="Ochromonas sp., Strain BG-1" /LENGTH=433 /DNA_ID=CAMNT_0014065687 /DNA_START=30 /DNA_END=1331 /DNA_ORIENTATION=-